MKRILVFIILSLLLSTLIGQTPGESLTITQIENRRLAIDGTADIFFLLRDETGEPRDLDSTEELALFSRAGNDDFKEAKILSLQRNAPREEGINFLLLIDNSGSMHDEQMGDVSRYETAAYALGRFLDSIDNPLDRIGVSAFNTYYTELSPVAPPDNAQRNSIEALPAPTADEAFTELYQAMRLAADELSHFSGRRALIILSDGENYPYTLRHDEHPEFGTVEVVPDDLMTLMSASGVSVYAVHIGDRRDPFLDRIAAASGGRGFGAQNRENLGSIYEEIRAEIQREYRVRFRHTYAAGGSSEVLLKSNGLEALGRYTVPHFFGRPSDSISIIYLLPVLIGLGVILLLLLIRFERPVSRAELNLLLPGKRFSAATRVALSDQRTVIGRSSEADMTIAGNPALKGSHATIVADKAGNYTVTADTEFKVNNRLTKEQRLKSGDVIDFEGTTIVFDKPVKEK